jgi:hypothetical protein
MARASRIVGFVPVGFLAVTAAIAAATVLGGWTAESARASAGYGIGWSQAEAPVLEARTVAGPDQLTHR